MARIIWDVSVSLDGFTSGPNVRPEEPMGDGGESLHEWMAGSVEADIHARDLTNNSVGAALIGRRTFELGLEPWGGTPWGVPSFVVTHRPQADLTGKNGGVFAFDNLDSAARRAKEAAGQKDAMVLGADLGRSLMRAGLLDAIWIHLVPILLGGGTPLFRGERAELLPEANPALGSVTHLRFRIGKDE